MSKSFLYKLRHLFDSPGLRSAPETHPQSSTLQSAPENHPQSSTSSTTAETPVSQEQIRRLQYGSLAILPNELLIQVFLNLTYDAQACLALANHHLKRIVGPECWYRLEEPQATKWKLAFLCQIGRDTPDYIPCSKCTAFHKKEMFLEEELQVEAQKRVCDEAFGRVAICSHDSIGWARLRAIIEGKGTSATHGVSLSSNGSCRFCSTSWEDHVEASYSMVMVQGSVILRTRLVFPAIDDGYHVNDFDGLLCPHSSLEDNWVGKFCICRRSHTRGQACSHCPYPACCTKCATEIDQAIEIIKKKQCLVITTWRRLSNGGQDALTNWERQCRKPYGGIINTYADGKWRRSTHIREDFALGWHLRHLREEGFNITETPAQ